jgi:hypothetical protein
MATRSSYSMPIPRSTRCWIERMARGSCVRSRCSWKGNGEVSRGRESGEGDGSTDPRTGIAIRAAGMVDLKTKKS